MPREGDDDDVDNNNDDDDGSSSDAVIQYGSLHTCQNKRTDAVRAERADRGGRGGDAPSEIRRRPCRSARIGAGRADTPTPARADAARRVASRQARRITVVAIRMRARRTRGEEAKEKERQRKNSEGQRGKEPRVHDTYAASARHRLAAARE